MHPVRPPGGALAYLHVAPLKSHGYAPANIGFVVAKPTSYLLCSRRIAHMKQMKRVTFVAI